MFSPCTSHTVIPLLCGFQLIFIIVYVLNTEQYGHVICAAVQHSVFLVLQHSLSGYQVSLPGYRTVRQYTVLFTLKKSTSHNINNYAVVFLVSVNFQKCVFFLVQPPDVNDSYPGALIPTSTPSLLDYSLILMRPIAGILRLGS
jgi:hypothetical protein